MTKYIFLKVYFYFSHPFLCPLLLWVTSNGDVLPIERCCREHSPAHSSKAEVLDLVFCTSAGVTEMICSLCWDLNEEHGEDLMSEERLEIKMAL